MKNQICVNIIKLRTLHKLSQEELAEKVGVSRQTVSKWESGETMPDIENCRVLADLFSVKIDDLIYFDESKSPYGIPPKGKHIFGTVKVGERGQIVIPKDAREIFDIKSGDNLILLGDEKAGLAIIKAEWIEVLFVRRVQYPDALRRSC